MVIKVYICWLNSSFRDSSMKERNEIDSWGVGACLQKWVTWHHSMIEYMNKKLETLNILMCANICANTKNTHNVRNKKSIYVHRCNLSLCTVDWFHNTDLPDLENTKKCQKPKKCPNPIFFLLSLFKVFATNSVLAQTTHTHGHLDL